MAKTAGTKEWASSNVNFVKGCSNNCRYCYAKNMALRFKRINTPAEWATMVVDEAKVTKGYGKRKGRIMLPSAHDITQDTLGASIVVIRKLLEAGNDLLITTKPDSFCIQALCLSFAEYKDHLQFRFTIGTDSDRQLRYWEPGAPNFTERILAIKVAYEAGFKTSISMEPLLTLAPEYLIEYLDSFITETIWIGVMNGIPKEIDGERREIIERTRDPIILRDIYNSLKLNPKIRWKDSVQKILGLKNERGERQ